VVAVRVLTVVVGLALVALCGIGVLVAALLERDRFGDRDESRARRTCSPSPSGSLPRSAYPWRCRFSWPAALTATVVAVAGAAGSSGSRSQGDGVLG